MLEPLIIEKTEQNPKVILDKENQIFQFSGRTLLEDAIKFYTPVQNWIERYIKDPNESTELILHFDYINSASLKKIVKIIGDLESIIDQGKTVKVVWFYKKDDEVMKEKGTEIMSVSKLPITFREIE